MRTKCTKSREVYRQNEWYLLRGKLERFVLVLLLDQAMR